MAVSKALSTTKKAVAKKAAPKAIEEAAYVIEGIPTVEQFTTALKENAKLYVEGEGETGSFLAETIERAETGQDVFGGGGELLKVKEHLGEVFNVLGIDAVRNSDFNEEGGMGVYLIISAVDANGELVKIGVGQTDPMGKLVKLNELEAFPWRVSFETSKKETRRGFKPINLVSCQALDKNGQKVEDF